MSSLLNLQGVIIYKVVHDKQTINIKIGQPRKPSCCPSCGSKKIHSHGWGRNRTIKHGKAMGGQMILLNWKSKRYKCSDCLKSFSKSPPKSLAIGKNRSSSVFDNQALRDLQERSFSSVSKDMNVSYTVLKRILVNGVKGNELFKLPKYGDISLGIDEHAFLKKKLATTVTLVNPDKTLLGIIPHATSSALNCWTGVNFTYEQRLGKVSIHFVIF